MKPETQRPKFSESWLCENAELIYKQAEVEAAIATMAANINAELGHDDVLLLCVMNGGMAFTTQLMFQLNMPVQLDYVHATRYGDRQVGGAIRWLAEPHEKLRERRVLVADDILDEGQTLRAIVEYCYRQGAAEVNTAVLVEKQHQRRSAEVHADYRGLLVPDRYVFGYGMDCEGYGRNLSGIYAHKNE